MMAVCQIHLTRLFRDSDPTKRHSAQLLRYSRRVGILTPDQKGILCPNFRVHSFFISIDGFGSVTMGDRGQARDFAILERWLRDHSTIQRWRVTENRKSQA